MKCIDLETGKTDTGVAIETQNKKTYAKIHNMENRLKEMEKMTLKVDQEKLLLSKDPKKKQKDI